MWKDLILNILEFPIQTYTNTLIKRKKMANSFKVLVFEVLSLSVLDTRNLWPLSVRQFQFRGIRI